MNGCGGNEEAAVEEAFFKDWKLHTNGNVKILYPEGHPQENKIPAIDSSYQTAINQICTILEMDKPADTLVIIYYTGYKMGREQTGREYPFTLDTVIHFWLPSFLGPTLVRYLLPKWSSKETRFPFLEHGLISAFDFSGQNYHQVTLDYVEKEMFIPLEELAVDTTVNSDEERLQSGEAASFCAYILSTFGAERFKTMYEAELNFEDMVGNLFYMPVDSLQVDWLEYAKQFLPPDTVGGAN